VLPDIRIYYAVKSNNHPAIARTFVEAGLGLDVSSGRELQLALDCGAEDIVFSGPGKTMNELSLAVASRDRITVLIDSFGELERLDSVASKANAFVRAGVRMTANEQPLWAKFGIPLSALPEFWAAAAKSRKVRLRGDPVSHQLEPGPGQSRHIHPPPGQKPFGRWTKLAARHRFHRHRRRLLAGGGGVAAAAGRRAAQPRRRDREGLGPFPEAGHSDRGVRRPDRPSSPAGNIPSHEMSHLH